MSRRKAADYQGLGEIPSEALEAYRYLCAKIAVEAGRLRELAHECSPEGDLLTCIDWATGKLCTVSCPIDWSSADEQSYVGQMRHLLVVATSGRA